MATATIHGPSLRQLKRQRQDLTRKQLAILDRADNAGRALNAAEVREHDALSREAAELDGRIAERDDTNRRHAELLDLRFDNASILAGSHRRDNFELAADMQRLLHFCGRGQSLGMQAAPDDRGGYAVPESVGAEFYRHLEDLNIVRGLATVLSPMTETSRGAPVLDTELAAADWTAEVPANDLAADNSMTFGLRSLTPHMMVKFIRASRLLWRMPGIPQILLQRLAAKAAVTEEKAFLTGDGNQKPLGVFVTSADGIPASQDQETTLATGLVAADVVKAFYRLPARHQRHASWIMSPTVAQAVRLLIDPSEAYAYREEMDKPEPTLLGRPLFLSDHAPATMTAGKPIAVVGDFSEYYVQDGVLVVGNTQLLMELLSRTNEIGILLHHEVDGAPAKPTAFVRLKCKAD